MCSVTAAMIGLTALQGFSQYSSQRAQYKAQAQAYDAQAKAAQQNARIQERQREQVADQYALRQKQLDDKRRLILGQQAASAGASGLDGVGSALDAGAAAIDQWRSDSMNLLGNQRRDTLSVYQNQVNYENQANAARTAASNIRSQARAAAFATILGTAASMYGAYKTYGNAAKEPVSKQGNAVNYASESDSPLLNGVMPGIEDPSLTPLFNNQYLTGGRGMSLIRRSGPVFNFGYNPNPWNRR